jgi:hypothetical protein
LQSHTLAGLLVLAHVQLSPHWQFAPHLQSHTLAGLLVLAHVQLSPHWQLEPHLQSHRDIVVADFQFRFDLQFQCVRDTIRRRHRHCFCYWLRPTTATASLKSD